MANTDIRRLAKANGVPLWRLCEYFGFSEPTMTRRLRKELTENEKAEFREAISLLTHEGIN